MASRHGHIVGVELGRRILAEGDAEIGFATHLLEDGYDLRTIQKLPGHTDLRTTQSIPTS